MPKRKKTDIDIHNDIIRNAENDLTGEKGGVSAADFDSDIAFIDEDISEIPDIDDTVDISERLDYIPDDEDEDDTDEGDTKDEI